MNRVIQTDISAVITNRVASAFTTLIAGGAGNNVAVNGLTLDRVALGTPLCADLVVAFQATLGAANTLSLPTVKIQHSPDGQAWTDYLVSTAPGVVATGPAGGGTVYGQARVAVNLSSAYQYVRTVVTPDLSAANTDTATVVALWTLAGFDEIPSPT